MRHPNVTLGGGLPALAVRAGGDDLLARVRLAAERDTDAR